MSDNYIVINGKRVELTDEQVKALGIKERKNPFRRVVKNGEYYYINGTDRVEPLSDTNGVVDNDLHRIVNYFNDKKFAEQVALHQLLYRKLLKFAYDNGFEDTAEWNGANEHWLIIYYKFDDDFGVVNMETAKELSVYFSTEEGASRAINEVIRPFMKEHPEFVW